MDVSANGVELLLLILSSANQNGEKCVCVCGGNENPGNGLGEKSWSVKELGDAKLERRFPGQEATGN